MRERVQVSYDPDMDERCRLDVYTADRMDPKLAPCIIYIHGGGWVSGNHLKTLNNCNSLSKTYNVVAVSYRLSCLSWHTAKYIFAFFSLTLLTMMRKHNWRAILAIWTVVLLLCFACFREGEKHPTHVQDIATAARWAKKNVSFNGAMFLMGHSAGAHQAALLATHPTYKHGLEDCLKGVICISGVYNPNRLRDVAIGNLLHFEVFGEEEYDAFPIFHVTKNTIPHLLLNAEHDIGLKRDTRDYFMTLFNKKVFVRARVYPNTNHITICRGWESYNSQILTDIQTFIAFVQEKQNVSAAEHAQAKGGAVGE